MNPKKIIPLAIAILTVKTNVCVSSQFQDDDSGNTYMGNTLPPHRCPKRNMMTKVSYNSASTSLNVLFPANGRGGKVEIYRNGAKVVDTPAPAGANLCYLMRNYGKGEFTIIVSQGNTVVYSNNITIK